MFNLALLYYEGLGLRVRCVKRLGFTADLGGFSHVFCGFRLDAQWYLGGPHSR